VISHARIAVDALNAGKHVFVEKTMAYSLPECKEMALAATRNKRVLQVGHQRHSNRLYARALEMIHIARSLGMKIMLGCMLETSVAITAAAHLTPLVDYADLDGNYLIAHDPFEGVKVVRGKLTLSEEPGLGVRRRAEGRRST
jgi:hypothetical protein